jgi:hypothetical protein
MVSSDYIVIGFLTLWTVVSLGYCFRSVRRRLLPGWNRRFRTWTSWRLFSPDDHAVPSGVLELDYRDWDPAGMTGAWIAVEDACWSWHAFLWMPRRRLVNRIYHLIRELAAAVERLPRNGAPPPPAWRLGRYLARRYPARAGTIREFRLVVRHRSDGPPEETIYAFNLGADGSRA